MSLAWCMIALSLVGADDQKFGTPPPSGVAPLATAVKTAQTRETWLMDLATATRIAFDNSENFRLIQLGVDFLDVAFSPLNTDGPIAIARLNAGTPVSKFKADAMALVRSVEQQYWNLVQEQVTFESAEQTVRMTQELLQKVQSELTLAHCDPGVTEAAEAAQRLEQFNIEVTTRKADVVTAERAARKTLGLPPTNNRRIVPTTKPAEELISFDWETCVDELLRNQPDNVQQQARFERGQGDVAGRSKYQQGRYGRANIRSRGGSSQHPRVWAASRSSLSSKRLQPLRHLRRERVPVQDCS